MKRLGYSLIVLGILAAAAPAAPVPGAEKARPVVVPFETILTGHMTVMAKVNGQGPYKLIFDTGAPVTLLNNRLAKATGLLKNVPKSPFAFFGAAGEVKVKQFAIGDAEIEDMPAIVMDHPAVEALSDAVGQIDGIVGFPFFARFTMTLDYQAKTMTFVPNGYDPPDVLRSMMTTMLLGKKDVEVLAPKVQLGVVPRKDADDEDAGVVVQQVLAGSPAEKAGLKVGDRLLTLDDRWTDSLVDLFRATEVLKPDVVIEAKIQRDGKPMTIKLTPASGF
jgi:hypothetical protein